MTALRSISSLLLVGGLFCSIYSSPSLADWKVQRLRGQVTLEAKGTLLPVHMGQILPEGSLLQTGPSSRLEMRNGPSTINLGSKTKFKIEKSTPNHATNLEVLYGKLRATVEVGGPPRSIVKTNTAVVGVRGTEFFISKTDRDEFFCTLKGEIEVTLPKENKKIIVPDCAGVRIADGVTPEVNITPSLLSKKWIGDTSDEIFQPDANDTYTDLPIFFKPAGKKIYYGIKTHFFYGIYDQIKYYDQNKEFDSNQFFLYRTSPQLKYTGLINLFWSPELLGSFAQHPLTVDAEALNRNKNTAELRIGEAYLEYVRSELTVRVGRQGIKWGDGALLSKNFWDLDPTKYLAIRAKYHINSNFFDIFASFKEPSVKLTGNVPGDFVGLRYDHMSYLSFYALRRSFISNNSANTEIFQLNHEINDIGFTSQKKLRIWDYKLRFDQQFGTLFKGSTSSEINSSKANMYEVELGLYPIPMTNFRFSLNTIRASERFVPGLESPYLLGYSRILSRSNIQVFRAKLSYRWNDNIVSYFQIQKSLTLGESPLTLWSGNKKDLAQEWSLSSNIKIEDNQNLLATFYGFVPKEALSSNNNTGHGLLINYQWAF